MILGVSGMLGHQLWRHNLSKNYQVYGVVRKSRESYPHMGLFDHDHIIDNIDARDFRILHGILEQVKPEVVLNCIGVTKRRELVGKPADSIRLNALLPHTLAEWGLKLNFRVINFSTDCVFDGEDGFYDEDSPTTARDLYGRTKALGEITGKNALTIRSSFIGPELENGTELFEWFISQKGTVKGFTNAIYSGLTTIELSRVVEKIITKNKDCNGLYHISSNPISKYDLLAEVMEHMALPIKLVPDGEFKCDRSLNSNRFKTKYQYKAPSWKEMVAELTHYKTRNR